MVRIKQSSKSLNAKDNSANSLLNLIQARNHFHFRIPWNLRVPDISTVIPSHYQVHPPPPLTHSPHSPRSAVEIKIAFSAATGLNALIRVITNFMAVEMKLLCLCRCISATGWWATVSRSESWIISTDDSCAVGISASFHNVHQAWPR